MLAVYLLMIHHAHAGCRNLTVGKYKLNPTDSLPKDALQATLDPLDIDSFVVGIFRPGTVVDITEVQPMDEELEDKGITFRGRVICKNLDGMPGNSPSRSGWITLRRGDTRYAHLHFPLGKYLLTKDAPIHEYEDCTGIVCYKSGEKRVSCASIGSAHAGKVINIVKVYEFRGKIKFEYSNETFWVELGDEFSKNVTPTLYTIDNFSAGWYRVIDHTGIYKTEDGTDLAPCYGSYELTPEMDITAYIENVIKFRVHPDYPFRFRGRVSTLYQGGLAKVHPQWLELGDECDKYVELIQKA